MRASSAIFSPSNEQAAKNQHTVSRYSVVRTRISTNLSRGGQKLFYVDLSKLCNLGTYQEIGKNVIMKLLQKEIFISKNTFFLVFMLNSQQKIEQNKIYGQNC